MRADNHGEGGILALLALVRPHGEGQPRRRAVLVGARAVRRGAALRRRHHHAGISVLGAVEGSEVATPALAALRRADHRRSSSLVLFSSSGAAPRASARSSARSCSSGSSASPLLGIRGHPRTTRRCSARVNPCYAVRFFLDDGLHGFLVLGSVVLVITGGEALYADMGHFGARPIRLAWFAVVLPALLLNYFGQGALLLRDPAGARRIPFYALVPALGALPDGRARHRGDGRRLAGADLRRVLADPAGGAARLLPARDDRPHLGTQERADLHPRGELGALRSPASRWCWRSRARPTWRRPTASR